MVRVNVECGSISLVAGHSLSSLGWSVHHWPNGEVDGKMVVAGMLV